MVGMKTANRIQKLKKYSINDGMTLCHRKTIKL